MKDCNIQFGSPSSNDSISHCLKSILRIKSEHCSSSESLLTLLNTSIEQQQASFQSLDECCVNMSKHNSQNQIPEDEELEMFVGKNLEMKFKIENRSELEDSHKKKKKKKHKDRDGTNSTKNNLEIPMYDEILYKRNKKEKHKHSRSEVEDNSERKNKYQHKLEKSKKKKHRDLDVVETDGSENLKKPDLEISEASFHDLDISQHKSKKSKRNRSSISDMEDYYAKKSNLESDFPKKRKKTQSSASEEENKYGNKSELENISSKKNKKKNSIISEDNQKESTNIGKISPKKKKKKHSSISETDNNHENSPKLEIDSPKKRKKKHFSVSEVQLNSSMEIESYSKKKKKHSSSSEIDDNNENSKNHSSISEVQDNSSMEIKSASKKKEKHRSISEVEDNLSMENESASKKKEKHHSISEVDDNSSMEIESASKKKKKHHSISEVQDNSSMEIKSASKKKEKHRSISEVEDNLSMEIESASKKKEKHHSISEVDDNSSMEIESASKKKEKHHSISEVHDNSSMEIESASKKKKHSSSSEVEDNLNLENEPSRKSNKNSSSSDTDVSVENSAIFEKAQVENRKKRRKPKSKLSMSLLESVKNNHKKYYLAPKGKSENEDEEDLNKNKTMDVINEALDVALEKKQLNDEDMNILRDLQVLIPWQLPESHTIETRLSHPTSEQQKRFKEIDTAMKSGQYSKEEDLKIMRNWEEFCQEHDLKISPLLLFPVEGETRSLLPPQQRLNFVRYLGKGLKHRTLCSIYSRFQLLFRPYKKGKFSPEEDNIILTFIENSSVSNKYSALSTILNRGRELIKRRHQVLVADDEKIEWDTPLLQELLTNLLEATGKEDVDELKEFAIQAGHWKVLEKKMGIPATKIKRKWMLYLYPRLFIEEYDTLNDIRLKLIDLLYDSQETDRKNINWVKMAQNFDGVSSVRLYKIFLDMFAMYVTEADKANFRDTVICLKEMVPHMLVQKTRHLKKFIYHDNKLFNSKMLEPIVTF